jgi:putative transposase
MVGRKPGGWRVGELKIRGQAGREALGVLTAERSCTVAVGFSPRQGFMLSVSRSDTAIDRCRIFPCGRPRLRLRLRLASTFHFQHSHTHPLLEFMANTFTCIRLHVVFSTKNRQRWITPDIEKNVWRYLGGICRDHGAKALMVGGVEDHVHLLIRVSPAVAISELMRRLKGESSKWISTEWPALAGFSWQDGYGAFSIGQAQVAQTIDYIARQRSRHARVDYADEFRKFVLAHELPVDERYLLG